MTKAEALAQAQVKWGPKASVEFDSAGSYPRLKYVHATGAWSVYTSGRGRTWEKAFADAEYVMSVRGENFRV